MKAAPNVEHVERDAAEAAALAAKVADQYGWYHASGYTRSIRSSGNSGATPEAMVAGQHERVRSQLAVAATKLRNAVVALAMADRALASAAHAIEGRPPAEVPEDKLLGEPVSRAEVRRAEQAQRRRNDRRNGDTIERGIVVTRDDDGNVVTERLRPGSAMPWARDEATG